MLPATARRAKLNFFAHISQAPSPPGIKNGPRREMAFSFTDFCAIYRSLNAHDSAIREALKFSGRHGAKEKSGAGIEHAVRSIFLCDAAGEKTALRPASPGSGIVHAWPAFRTHAFRTSHYSHSLHSVPERPEIRSEEVEKQAPLKNQSDYRHHSGHRIRAYRRTQLPRQLPDIPGQDGTDFHPYSRRDLLPADHKIHQTGQYFADHGP